MAENDTTIISQQPRRLERLTWTIHTLFSAGEVRSEAPMRLLGAEHVIGRSSSCAVALVEDGRLSRKHAILRLGSDGLSIEDTSANGTLVNGQAIESERLEDGDLIRVGDSFLLMRRRGPGAGSDDPLGGLIGPSPAMVELRRSIGLVGPTATPVLIEGETGTGKELVARALHAIYRPDGAFVPVNCGAIPHSLAEAAFFGHTKGAFSGADAAQPGYFRGADGGVLFLDEVGELPASLQPLLLRALEDKHVTPVGSTKPVACDVRVIAATNRDLHVGAQEGTFRADLFARLAEFTLATPPLRDRPEDVLPILQEQLDPQAPPLTPELVDRLLRHHWPYNVRELVKLASELSLRGADADTLELELVRHRLQPPRAAEPTSEVKPTAVTPTKTELEALLRTHSGVVVEVARATGRSRKQVYRWLQRHGLDVTRFRPAPSSDR